MNPADTSLCCSAGSSAGDPGLDLVIPETSLPWLFISTHYTISFFSVEKPNICDKKQVLSFWSGSSTYLMTVRVECLWKMGFVIPSVSLPS